MVFIRKRIYHEVQSLFSGKFSTLYHLPYSEYRCIVSDMRFRDSYGVCLCHAVRLNFPVCPLSICPMRSVSSLCILPPLSAYSVLLFLCFVPYFSLSMPVGIRRFWILWFCKVLTFLLLFGCRVYTYIVNWVVYGNRVLCHFTIGVVLGFLIFWELRGVSCP